jgi:hypothetical protein
MKKSLKIIWKIISYPFLVADRAGRDGFLDKNTWKI